MKMSDILTKKEIVNIKILCNMFNATCVIIDGVKYVPPKKRNKNT
jgi:hypothetical protein